MSMTVGPGPFGHAPIGVFNVELPPVQELLYLEPFPRRIRGEWAGETVVDSRHTRMLWEHGSLPIYMFPRDEVRTGLLVASDHRSASKNKGETRWWDLRSGDRVEQRAAWEHPAPPPEAPPLGDLIGFRWSALDRWREEDEEAIVHARDPYHRVDAVDTQRHVRVALADEPVAETRRARVIFETGLPPRWYIPREDVRMDLLEPTEKRTGCAYKGFASYWSVRTGQGSEENVAWTYEEPRREFEPIRGYVCFLNERVDLELDGELQERPITPWSPDWRGPRPEKAIEGPPGE